MTRPSREEVRRRREFSWARDWPWVLLAVASLVAFALLNVLTLRRGL